MRICLAGAKSCPPIIGGIEVFVFEIGRRMVSKGVEVTIIVPRGPNQSRTEDVEGISVRRIRAIRNRYSLKMSMMPGELWVGAELRPDVFHANDPPSGIVSLTSSRWKNRVLTVHGIGVSPSEWATPFRQAGGFLQKLAVKGADAVTTTDSVTAKMLSRYRNDITVIPSGVDTHTFRRNDHPRPSALAEGKVNMLFIGRLNKVKGVDLLLEGLAQIDPEVRKKLKLTIVGDGPMAATVRDHSSHAHQLDWIGEIPHKEVPAYLANADLLIMPSRSEGLPITMLEAMSSGLPVVATTVGGVGTYFDDRHLVRIESLSAQGVAKAIEYALENKNEMIERAKTARELVESRFSWDSVADAYLKLYEETSRRS